MQRQLGQLTGCVRRLQRWRPFKIPEDASDFVRGLFTICGAGRCTSCSSVEVDNANSCVSVQGVQIPIFSSCFGLQPSNKGRLCDPCVHSEHLHGWLLPGKC